MKFGIFILLVISMTAVYADEDTVVVRPKEIDDVLVNPGMGFTTFKRFNGDPLKRGGDVSNYPVCSVAYFRLYWDTLEPEQGHYRWDYIDGLLKKARERGQTIMFRISAHATIPRVESDLDDGNHDVPAWYRAMVGKDYERTPYEKWRTDPEDPRYVKYFGKLISEFCKRYDGHPDVDSIDLAICGAWGEGAGSSRLSDGVRHAMVDAYADNIKKTPLMAMLMDEKSNAYIQSKTIAGWRADCLGDMGGFNPKWSHMEDRYPEAHVQWGLADVWMKAPVSFESCWTMQRWKDSDWDIDYIIEQSLKWHMSTFNNKSAAIPKEWWPKVNGWLKRMGYRFVLRKFTFPEEVSSGGTLAITSWWENKGVAPIYHEYPLAVKLEGNGKSEMINTDADPRKWLPGDAIYDSKLTVPTLPAGQYTVSVAMLDPTTNKPRVKLAIAGVQPNGWYPMGKIRVK